MGDCKNCGGCGACGGCGGCGSLELTKPEVVFLQALGQYSFLPVARKADDMTPVYLEEDAYTKETYSAVLQLLEVKRLIRIDYDGPLKGADMSAYAGYPVHGSAALTQRGQHVLDILEKQGIGE